MLGPIHVLGIRHGPTDDLTGDASIAARMTPTLQDPALIARTLHERARTLALLAELEVCQQDAAACGCEDIFKRVSGASSIENAVAAARRVLEAQERVLTQLTSDMHAQPNADALATNHDHADADLAVEIGDQIVKPFLILEVDSRRRFVEQ